MIRVTVEDLEAGTKEAREIDDDYIVVCAGRVYLDGAQSYSNGTMVLTLKRASASPRAMMRI